MKPEQIRELINSVLQDAEEEEIGISLLSRHYQNQSELAFFNEIDRKAVFQILEKLSKDSQRHKQMLDELVDYLGEKLNEQRIS